MQNTRIPFFPSRGKLEIQTAFSFSASTWCTLTLRMGQQNWWILAVETLSRMTATWTFCCVSAPMGCRGRNTSSCAWRTSSPPATARSYLFWFGGDSRNEEQEVNDNLIFHFLRWRANMNRLQFHSWYFFQPRPSSRPACCRRVRARSSQTWAAVGLPLSYPLL